MGRPSAIGKARRPARLINLRRCRICDFGGNLELVSGKPSREGAQQQSYSARPLSCESWNWAFFMYSKNFLTILLTLAALSPGSAQNEIPRDTLQQSEHTRVFTLPEYVISANRWKSNVATLPSSVTVLTKDDLARAGGGTLASVLHGIPGLFVKSYGGPGSVSTTSIRGMGAEHTLVLVDGQRYNNVRDGQVDFGIFPVQNIDRVEVLRGGFSSVYGADALGGIVSIITQRPEASPRVRAAFSAGSFGMHGGEASADFRVGGIGLLLSARQESGRGDYEFKFQDGVTSSILRRQNADYVLRHLRLYADAEPIPGAQLRWSANYNWSDRGSPGAVLSPESSNRARLHDAGFQSQLTLQWKNSSRLSVGFSTLFNAQRRTYVDPLLPGTPSDQESDFSDRTVVLTPHVRYVLNSWAAVNAGAEYSASAISSRQLEAGSRSQTSFFVSTDHTIELGGDVLYQVNIFPSVRYDRLSDMEGEFSPKLGMNVGVWRPLAVRVKSSVGKSYRAPSFNDLYWKNGGNPLLQPERSVGVDAGISWTFMLGGPLEMEAGVFDVRTIDRIVWTPDANGFWTPRNLQEVQSAGIELGATWRLWDDMVVVRSSYTNADSKKTGSATTDDQTLNKQLPYLPHETASLGVTLRADPISIHLMHEYTGFRYTTETNDARYVLQPYQKTDVGVAANVLTHPFAVTVRFNVENLLNSDYQIFPNFPMPLRTMVLRLLVEY